MRSSAFAVVTVLAVSACQSAPPPSTPPAPTESPAFTTFVDEFLDQFAAHHPSIAAGNGLHQADERLEDFSAAAIASEIAMWRRMGARLEAISAATLGLDQRVDHRIISGLIDAWILELDTNRNWQKNLMIYASSVSDGVHNLMTMESAPADVRARRIIDKLKGVPALVDAARVNIVNPPRVMAERGVRMLRGASAMLTGDLRLAFADLKEPKLQGDLEAAGKQAAKTIDAFVAWFEKEKLPKADGPFMVGTANLEARYRAEELIDLPAAQLLTIGERELANKEAAFVAAAARVDNRKPRYRSGRTF